MTILFGTDATAVAARYPLIDVDTDAPVTPARLTALIEEFAAELEAVIRSQYGSGAAQAIEDEDGTTRARCRSLVLTLMGPSLYRAAHHVEVPIDITDEASDARVALRKDPTLAIGYLPTGDASSGTRASTTGMSTSVSSRESRRQFDGRAQGRTGGGFVY